MSQSRNAGHISPNARHGTCSPELIEGDRAFNAGRRGRMDSLCVWYQWYDGGNALFF